MSYHISLITVGAGAIGLELRIGTYLVWELDLDIVCLFDGLLGSHFRDIKHLFEIWVYKSSDVLFWFEKSYLIEQVAHWELSNTRTGMHLWIGLTRRCSESIRLKNNVHWINWTHGRYIV